MEPQNHAHEYLVCMTLTVLADAVTFDCTLFLPKKSGSVKRTNHWIPSPRYQKQNLHTWY